jgi:WD40 repeat protein
MGPAPRGPRVEKQVAAVDPISGRFAVAGDDGSVTIHDPATGETYPRAAVGTGPILGLAWNHDGTLLAALCADTAAWWDPRRRGGRLQRPTDLSLVLAQGPASIAFDTTGQNILISTLTGHYHGFFVKPDAHAGQPCLKYWVSDGPITSTCASPAGGFVAAACGDRIAVLDGTFFPDLLMWIPVSDAAPTLTCLTVSPDGRRILAGDVAGNLRSFDLWSLDEDILGNLGVALAARDATAGAAVAAAAAAGRPMLKPGDLDLDALARWRKNELEHRPGPGGER